MASLTLRGSSVADATLTTACDMSLNTTGGVETSKTTTITFSGTNFNYAEITSQGLSVVDVSAIPATPTGKGWVYNPGAGEFALGNWSASITVDPTGWSGSSSTTTLTLRAFRYSGGAYTSIGSWSAVNVTGGTFKTTYSFPNTSFSSIVFGPNDLVYFDLWFFDGTGASGDNPVIYVSNSATTGVASDMQVTTSNFKTPIDLSTRFRLGKALDLVTRFRLGKARDLSTRFILGSGSTVAKDLASRFRLSALKNSDLASRFRLGKALDLSSRFRLGKALDLTSRFRLGKALDLSTRLRLGKALDLATRFILASVGTSATKDLSTRFILIAHTYTSQDASINKFQVVKCYDPNMNFIDVIRDAPFLSCKENISAAADTVSLTLPRAIDAFDGAGQPGSMNTIVKGNILQWWLYGAGLPANGLLKFNGKIDEISPTLEESGAEYVEVTVTPFSQILGDHGVGTTPVVFGTAGNSATYVDTAVVLSAFFTGSYYDRTGTLISVLDPVTGLPYGDPYTMDPASLVSTGQFIQFPFQSQKLISVVTNILALSTNAYFLRMNQDKTALFGAIPSDPTHTLLLGQNISSISYSMSDIPRKNVIIIQGAGSVKATATGSSVETIGERVYLKSDNRITDNTTAQLMANGILSILDRETVRAKIKVPDYRGSAQSGLGYDIEAFKVGQTVKIVDARAPSTSTAGVGAKWGSAIWGTSKWGNPAGVTIWGAFNWGGSNWSASVGSIFNQVVTIVSIDYKYHYVELELGARQPSLSRALFDLEIRTQDATLV